MFAFKESHFIVIAWLDLNYEDSWTNEKCKSDEGG